MIRSVSQPLGAIVVKGLALADEGVEHLEWKTNFISWKKKESTSVPELEMGNFKPNPSYYEGQILSLFINTDKKVTETFQLSTSLLGYNISR